MKGAAVMFDYRRAALWIAVLLVPGGILLFPLLLADLRRQGIDMTWLGRRWTHGSAPKAATAVSSDDPKTPNDGPGSSPRTPHDGTTPPLAA